MANTPEEDLLAWLTREEEVLGADATIRASQDVDYAVILLQNELGYTPTDTQVTAFQGAGQSKYSTLPDIGISFSLIEHAWGAQATYQDTTTGRFISSADVQARISGQQG